MSLYLKIDADENAEFFTRYDMLSPLRQKIWNKICQLCRRWLVAKPSQSKIAEWCGCSRSAVSEAFKLFKEWGWLTLLSRGFKKSKTILISPSKTQLDVIKREYFKRVEATYGATHTYSIYKNITGRRKGEILQPPKCVEKFGFELKDSLKMALVPEVTLQEALRKAKDLGKQGWRPDKDGPYLAGIAVNMAKNNGIALDWPSYYRSLKI